MQHNALNTYQSNAVTTATPGELTLKLYNGAIKFIKQAKVSIEEKNFSKAHEFNIRVQDIIGELIITMNRDIPISAQLLTMYDYLLHRLVEANLKKEIAVLDEVEDFLTQFRDTWKEAMQLAKAAK
ncbi:flagellar export chaperone FliS [Brevibacillus fluminis]|uniref:flagellar export chaperone FliS n=1 Tax=Brevibacillus fluminis TaxID=511487 RepID=UPI003F89A8C9